MNWRTKGIEEVAGVGLVKLEKWCETMWKQYRKLVNRVHKMIVGVALAENTERAKQLTIFKATRGFDPENGSRPSQQYGAKLILNLSTKALTLFLTPKGNIDSCIAKSCTSRYTASSKKEIGLR